MTGSVVSVVRVVVAILFAGNAVADLLPTNNDPYNQIRFDTAVEADAKRQQLTNFIWATGLPTSALPTVTANVGSSIFGADLSGINQALVSQVTRLDVDVSGFDFHSLAYLLTPANSIHSNRVVIVHQGHSSYEGRFDSGIGPTVNALLAQGFSVNVMQQPLFGWNNDTTANVPGQGLLTYGALYDGHADMISTTGPALGGTGFRLFLEPVIQSINYFQTLSGLLDVSMIGISGGGWTTSLAAAMDERIGISVPVAGSAPFFYRNNNPTSVGDLEQFYDPLFNENIAPNGSGGGVATWMEIYALGGYGVGRQQVMVTNEFDPCCFSGVVADNFKDVVADTVALLGAGSWDYYRDSTSSIHEIAADTLSRVLFPALGVVRSIEDLGALDSRNSVPAPQTVFLVLVGLFGIALHGKRRTRLRQVSFATTPPQQCPRQSGLCPPIDLD